MLYKLVPYRRSGISPCPEGFFALIMSYKHTVMQEIPLAQISICSISFRRTSIKATYIYPKGTPVPHECPLLIRTYNKPPMIERFLQNCMIRLLRVASSSSSQKACPIIVVMLIEPVSMAADNFGNTPAARVEPPI